MDSLIPPTAAISPVKEQISCALDQEVVILNLGNGRYYSLNSVGAAVWTFIQQPRTLAQIAEFLLQEYEVTAEQCERDLQALMQEMRTAGLIEISQGAATG